MESGKQVMKCVPLLSLGRVAMTRYREGNGVSGRPGGRRDIEVSVERCRVWTGRIWSWNDSWRRHLQRLRGRHIDDGRTTCMVLVDVNTGSFAILVQ